MLQEFRVDNYKSLINITFKPQEVNLLIGLNNSGKTNLCQAMRFVSASTMASLDQCADLIAGGRFGVTNHFFDKRTIDFFVKADVSYEEEDLTFEYELTVSPPVPPTTTPTLQVESEKLTVTGGRFDGTVLLKSTRDRVKLLHEKDYLKGATNYVETTSPRDTTMLNRLYDLETNSRANQFKRHLSWWVYYDLSPLALRRPTHKPNEVLLNSEGSNLSSVLYRLKTSNERDYRKLLEVVQKVEPKLDLINFQVASESDVFMFFEDADGHRQPAWNASNGTLRFLALAYVLLIQPSTGLRPLIMVEEPENGVYVGFLKDLLEMAAQSPGRLQIIFTSHSPYFIDLFDDHLDSIFVLKTGHQHSTMMQPDINKVKAKLEHFPLGEQHFREMLG